MIDKNNALEYNYKILAQERKKQKISQDSAATQLTLSISQIKSLENNLDNGFVTPHFKNLALKRYAKFLGIDFYKIISQPDSQKKIIDYASKEEKVFSVSTKNPDLLQLLKLKIKKIGIIKTVIGLIILSLSLFFIIFQTNADKTLVPELATPVKNYPTPVKNYPTPVKNYPTPVKNYPTPVNKDFIQIGKLDVTSKKDVQEIGDQPAIVSTEFLCSVESASMDKVWSRVNPERPPTYFHIVSLKKQSICTIDNRGIIRKYDLGEGGKLTHRGEAPFKVQLNPSISELYFQGWKVYLEENDTFIQLNPVDFSIGLN